jgi:hypothetical protein
MLVAVPSPPPSEQEVAAPARIGATRERGAERADRQPERRVAKEAPRAPAAVPSRAAPGAARPKRELPPYLRVVK